MLEVVSPAGCPESVVAAVQNGADAVYLGFADYNARKRAIGFTPSEMARAIEYCRIRGVKTYLALNMIMTNSELPTVAERAKSACRYGIDAIIIQDLGAMIAVKQAVPEVTLFAGVRMNIHNLEAVKMAAAMGFKRAVLAPELSRSKLTHICKNSPIEIEILVHGNLCISYQGQCYLSAVLTKSSSNRGLCNCPCRQSFASGGNSPGYPLSLKDQCLVRYLEDMKNIGITAVKIEGRLRRPEYSAMVSSIYSKSILSGWPPGSDELGVLHKNFAKNGFSEGYYSGRFGPAISGEPEIELKGDNHTFSSTRKNYLNGEFQRVPVRFVGVISEGEQIKIGAIDDRGNTATAYGPPPEPAFHRQINSASLATQLHKTSGTPFKCIGVKSKVEPNLTVKTSVLNDIRHTLLDQLLQARKAPQVRAEGTYTPSTYEYESGEQPPRLNILVSKLSQLSKEIESYMPEIIYIPVTEFDYDSDVLMSLLNNENITISAVLPRVIHDNEANRISDALSKAAKRGVQEALISNLGQVQFARNHGLAIRADYGFNAYNSETLNVLRNLRFKSATISFEMKLSDVREMHKPLDCELIVYGRLPLMFTESCIIRSCAGVCACDNFTGLRDEKGALYPVLPEIGCRNILLSSGKLFMADRRRALMPLGLWAERLVFTTENAIECLSVVKRYAGEGDYEPPGFTRGLYYSEID